MKALELRWAYPPMWGVFSTKLDSKWESYKISSVQGPKRPTKTKLAGAQKP